MAREQRRLAAIVSADVAGYSRLMGRDETGTLMALKTLRHEVVDPPIAAHGGRIVKTTGDGLLLEFPSVVDAVRCVIEVQTAMAAKTADVPEDRRIAFRVGVNLGDIIIDGDDIFGDGVNIAARLESLAEPGGACLSEDAFRQVRGKIDVGFVEMGAQTLKNIDQPVHAWRWSPKSAPIAPVPALALPDKPSIAVLPFQNLSGDAEQEYFVDGLVEDIITGLSRFRSLFVIARNSSFAYKGRSPDIRQVGRDLGVRYVLEGSARKAGQRLHITGQLIDATDGTHLWADHFDGALEDVFDLQDRVTETVVNAIAPRVEQAEIERTKSKPTGKLDAYDYYLRGIAKLNSLMVPAAGMDAVRSVPREARALFEKAMGLDPDFALAYALTGQCYIIESNAASIADRAAVVAKAVPICRRAASLGKDDALALSHAGQCLAYLAGEIEEGDTLLERAIALNPNLAMAWNYGGWMKIFLGEPELAIQRFARAIRLNPLDPLLFLMQLGEACGHLFAGRHEEAAVWAERALRERRAAIIALRIGTVCLALGGRLDEAQRIAARLRELAPGFRIAHVPALFPLRRSQDLSKYSEGLRLAGLPE